MNDFEQRVRSFMQRAGQETPESATIPDFNTRKLRAALILEEAIETIEALGFEVRGDEAHGVYLDELGSPDLVKIADGCCDVMVVTLGTLIACGLKQEPLMVEVCNSNDSKFADGYYINSIGKVIKSPQYKPANFLKVLQEHFGWTNPGSAS